LKKIGVIQGFRVGIDISKMGMKPFKVNLYLKEHSKRREIINYVKYNPYLTFIGITAGFADIELELDLNNTDQLDKILEDLNYRFPTAIRNYDFIRNTKFHKVRCIPEL
jgi:hypothetical protein